MIRSHLAQRVRDAFAALHPNEDVQPEIADTKSPEHGDFACNLAMVVAKRLGQNPRALAEALAEKLRGGEDGLIEKVEVAGPGFLNLTLGPAAADRFLPGVLAAGAGAFPPRGEEHAPVFGMSGLASTPAEVPLRINVEYVSVNPNGPVTIGSGRGAAYGDTLANVLQAAGHSVRREFYINDGVNSEQMRQFALSVRALALGEPLPEKAYRGDYVAAVAERIAANPEADTQWWQEQSQALMIDRQRSDLAAFGVEFDRWFSEQSLHDAGSVEQTVQELVRNGNADEEPYQRVIERKKGAEPEEKIVPQAQAQADDEQEDAAGEGRALWLRSTKFGDDKDRVLRRSDGRLTYIASDVAYHQSKLERLGDGENRKLIDVLGPDHHGYIGRLKAVVQALGFRPDQLEVCIFQVVRFMKEGKPAPMRKRDGNIYALSDLVEEIGRDMRPHASPEEQRRTGADVVRFFYLMRSHDTHMDFDIDLAKKQSDENPVFYVQYAHARICSVLEKAREAGFEAADSPAGLLTHPREKALLLKVLDLPYEVRRCAADYGVHRLTTYAQELARAYHGFYDACRVIQADQPELTRARLALCRAAQIGLQATFLLIGISAPERMDRE